MKCIVVMFDSLNRHFLPTYGCDWVHAPNFQRLARRTVTFDKSYICSMPCMPARRDFHTGRPSFLHRGWGPLEPFDDSFIEMLAGNGVMSHLASDHYHYWEDGGANYHNRYSTWQAFRGQEGDPFICQVKEPEIPENINGKGRRSDWVNRQHIKDASQFPITQTFKDGVEFLHRNHDQDNWLLHIETFDPHEPYQAPREYRDLYPTDYEGPLFDWPGYRKVTESPEEVAEARRRYAALVSLCDARLGDVLDAMDKYDLWEDTMLAVWTDHGFMFGEHDCWAKNWMPLWQETANTPFFMWDPRSGKCDERRQSLVQPALDLAPTILEFFRMQPTERMLGKSLEQTIAEDTAVRETAIFGYFGQRINITDGHYVYMHGIDNPDCTLHKYTLMPSNMRGFWSVNELSRAQLSKPFDFSKNLPMLKVPFTAKRPQDTDPLFDSLKGSILYDVEHDPTQQKPLDDPQVCERMKARMIEEMRQCDAPEETYSAYGLA